MANNQDVSQTRKLLSDHWLNNILCFSIYKYTSSHQTNCWPREGNKNENVRTLLRMRKCLTWLSINLSMLKFEENTVPTPPPLAHHALLCYAMSSECIDPRLEWLLSPQLKTIAGTAYEEREIERESEIHASKTERERENSLFKGGW